MKRWSYFLEMVSFVANQMSCLTSSAYSKQLRAKLSMDASRLCMPCAMPGPSNSCTSSRVSVPSAAVYTSSTLPGPGTRSSAFLYTSPYA